MKNPNSNFVLMDPSMVQHTAIVQDHSKAPVEPVNILLVDDRPENLISLESILDSEHRRIIKATSGNEALKIVLQQEIALILLDVQMPEMDGFEVARLMKQNARTRDISIIFVTALSNESRYLKQGYDEGAVDYLSKPLDIHIVKAKVAVFEMLYRQKQELRRTNDRLTQINKQLDEFVYIVSHDLKAPLRGLSSLATFLEEELGSSPKQEVVDLITMMKSRTERMQQMIDGILHYSRMSNCRTEKEPVDVKLLINNIIDLISPPSHVRIEYPDQLPVLETEKIKIHEVLQNLILNAIKHNDKEEAVVKICCSDQGDHYAFTVSDNGKGIKPEHHDKVFGLFQTLVPKDKSEGTGLGLTIVKNLVEKQQGTVSLESEYGQGTAFTFTWKK